MCVVVLTDIVENLHLERVGDPLRNALVVEAGGLQCLKPGLVFFIQEVSNLFKDGHRVGLLLGVLANFDQHIEQFVDVGEVEVAGDHKVAGVRQLFWRRKGWQFSMSFLPNVP